MRRFRGLATGLFLLTGCGDDAVHHLPDGPPGADAAPGVDAPPAAGSITVTTLARRTDGVAPGAPIANAKVVVLDTDLSAGPTGMTGADGKATLDGVKPGSIVTAIYPANDTGGGNTQINQVTVVDVGPGANLVFGDHYFTAPNASGTETAVTVTWPTPPGGTSGVQLRWPCGGYQYIGGATQLSATIQVGAACAGTTMPIQLVAYGDGTDATGYIASAPATDGATASLSAWAPLPTDPNYTVAISGVAGTDSLDGVGAWQLYSKVTDDLLDYGAYTNPAADASGNATATLALPTDGLRAVSATYFANTDDAIISWHDITAWRGGPTPATVARPKLPYVSASLDFNIAGKIGFYATPGGSADAVVADVLWSIDTSMDGGPYENHEWHIIAPYTGQTAVDWSMLPAALAQALPPAGQTIANNSTVHLVDFANIASWDQVLATPEWQLAYPQGAVADGDASAVDVADGGEGNGGPLKAPRATAVLRTRGSAPRASTAAWPSRSLRGTSRTRPQAARPSSAR